MSAAPGEDPPRPVRWFRRFRRQPRRDPAVAAILAQVAGIAARLDGLERLLVRVQRDAERVKLHTGLVLGPDRALALLASGDRLYVDPRDGGCGINLLSEGRYEEEELRLFRRFLRPGIRILDIGANYGIYAMSAVRYVRPGGRITAFEPNPHIHGLLCSSAYLNGFWDVVDAPRLAASDTNGALRFEINETSPGGARIVRPGDAPAAHHLVIDVPVTRIDDFVGPDVTIDLVKIDVEGHEERVLRGMQAVIARSPDIKIFMELFYPLFLSDEHFARTIGFVTDDLGLRMNRILPGGRTEETGVEALRGATCNLILSREPLRPAPDLTVHPAQLNLGEKARLIGDALHWSAPATAGATAERMIAHGPYVYLPRGRYRLVVDADFDGAFICRILENYGDLLWQQQIGPGGGHVAEVTLTLDAPHFEIGFWSVGEAAAGLVLRSIEFWPV